MKLSIIVPAFNEEKELPDCLASIGEATAAVRETPDRQIEFELIVADNNSTDATARLAGDAGATVVFEPINQISRARNAGAAAATGDWLLFLDADSRLHRQSLEDLLQAIDTGAAAGGGCLIDLDSDAWSVRAAVTFWNFLSRRMKWAAGSFVFCRADAFADLQGFSEELYAAEEIDFSGRLKAWAKARGLRVLILTAHRHVSSARKMELYSTWEIFCLLWRLLFRPSRTLRDRSRLNIYYDGRR